VNIEHRTPNIEHRGTDAGHRTAADGGRGNRRPTVNGRRGTGGGFGIVAAVLLAAACAAPAAPVTLKFATLAPEGSAWMQTFEKLKAEAAEATGGAAKIRVYPAGVMGEEKDVLVKIKAGQLDGGGFLGNGIARICPEANALMFPMTFRSPEEVDAAMKALTPWLEERCRANGYVVLGWTEVGFSHVMGNRPVKGLDDFRGAKVWSIPNEPMLAALFKTAGISTIPVPVADVLPALQTGLLDTVYAPPLAAVSMQWTGRVKYRNDLRLAYTFGGLFVAETSWNRLPEEARAKVLAISRRLTTELTAEVRKSNAEALEVMAKAGIEVTHATDADAEGLRKVSDETRQRLRGDLFPAEADDRIQSFLKDHRAGAGAAHAP